MNKREIIGDYCHELMVKNVKQKLAFDYNADFNDYKKKLKDKLIELIGLQDVRANSASDRGFLIEEEVECDGYKRIRFTFESEVGSFVPCYLLIPNTGKKKYSLCITLQGHSSGFHNSIGVAKQEGDDEYISTRGDFAVQAVKQGYAALAIEQRCFGERATTRHEFSVRMCLYPTLNAFMMGRTTIGERVFDTMLAIDLMSNFSNVDASNVIITGNSGGGTMTFYMACLDDRITIAAPSCAFCSYETSILSVHHCACNYIPNAYKWFEMHDLSALITDKNFIVITGAEDKIFPLDGVKKSFAIVEKIFEKAGAKDKCKLVVTPKGHYWCKDLVWGAINEVADAKGLR